MVFIIYCASRFYSEGLKHWVLSLNHACAKEKAQKDNISSIFNITSPEECSERQVHFFCRLSCYWHLTERKWNGGRENGLNLTSPQKPIKPLVSLSDAAHLSEETLQPSKQWGGGGGGWSEGGDRNRSKRGKTCLLNEGEGQKTRAGQLSKLRKSVKYLWENRRKDEVPSIRSSATLVLPEG